MHFRIKRIKLLNALAKATRAVSVRSPLPVLTGIKFDLQAHQLILTGSDSDIMEIHIFKQLLMKMMI